MSQQPMYRLHAFIGCSGSLRAQTKKKHMIKKRVAAYCRVSTDSDAQLGSLENQMEAFQHQLALHNDWELV